MDILLILLALCFFKFDFKMALSTLLLLMSLACFMSSLSKLGNTLNPKEREKQLKKVVFYGIVLGIISLIFGFILITTYFNIFLILIFIDILAIIIKNIKNNKNNKVK